MSYQNWQTPDWLAEIFVQKVWNMYERQVNLGLIGSVRVLEPGSGRGNITKHLVRHFTEVTALEVDEGRLEATRSLCNSLHTRFEDYTGTADIVVSNPPFNVAMDWILHAEYLLTAHGFIAFILPSDFFQTIKRSSQLLNSGLYISQEIKIAGRVAFLDNSGIPQKNRMRYDSIFFVTKERFCLPTEFITVPGRQ